MEFQGYAIVHLTIMETVFLKEITPAEKIIATVECPASKSYTNRALLIAALAKGISTLRNPLFSDDTKYMRLALEQFGISVKQ